MSAEPTWYVVHTQPYAEMRAAEHLRRQGFEVYIPRLRKLRRHARKTETVVRPLFPRYFFVAFDMAAGRWQAVRSTVGISHLVGSESGPTAVSAEVVRELRGREDGNGFIELGHAPRFLRGDKVRLLNGAWSACLGLFEDMTDNDRIAVLLDMLGRKVRVVVPAKNVAPA